MAENCLFNQVSSFVSLLNCDVSKISIIFVSSVSNVGVTSCFHIACKCSPLLSTVVSFGMSLSFQSKLPMWFLCINKRKPNVTDIFLKRMPVVLLFFCFSLSVGFNFDLHSFVRFECVSFVV